MIPSYENPYRKKDTIPESHISYSRGGVLARVLRLHRCQARVNEPSITRSWDAGGLPSVSGERLRHK